MSTLEIINGERGEHAGGVNALVAVICINNETGEEMPVMFRNFPLIGVDDKISREVILGRTREIMTNPASLCYRFELRTFNAVKSEPVE